MYIDESFIKDRIAFLRNQKKISARDMSLSIGQSENYINIIENGKSLPSLHGLVLICEYFNITLKEFFDVENKNPTAINELIEEVKNLDDDAVIDLTNFIRKVKKNKSNWGIYG